MAIKRKTIQKSTATMLLVWMWFNLLLSPTIALAQELETEPTPTPEVQTTPEPTQIPEVTSEITPTPEAVSETTTGDATAVGETDTTLNQNTIALPGEITTGDCGAVEGQLDCPEDVIIVTDNEATASATLEADAETGENTITGEVDTATIDTGDAVAVGLASTEANTTTLELEPMSTPLPEATGTPVPEPVSLTVVNENTADVANTAQVAADTGNNSIDAPADVSSIDTGDASGLANVVNLVNTNIVGSGYQIVSIDVSGEDGADIDLNELWKVLLAVNESGDISQLSNWPSTPNLTVRIVNSNDATITNDINVTANTGGNTTLASDSGEIVTGDAVAAANVSNLVNTNIVGSDFLLVFINLLPGSKLNIILPRPELFGLGSEGGVNGTGLDWNAYNLATVENNVNATANTGENSSEGGVIGTGNALALANSTTIANTNVLMNDWFFLVLNNLGGWNGQIVGWSDPGSTELAGLGSTILQTGEAGEAENGQVSNGVISSTNLANITNNVNVSANTGQNSLTGTDDATIDTGNAAAIANVLNLVNMNILGSKWFMGMINILGGWGGKVIFAYPDVTVALSTSQQTVQPGDTITYDLHYENIGYDQARGVRVNLDLPTGMTFVSADGKLSGGCAQTYCSWDVGSLSPKQAGDMKVQLRVDDGFDFNKNLSLLSRLMPSAKAGDERKDKEINVRATIATSDPESDTSNNSYSVTGVVYEKLPGGGMDQRQPNLSVTAWNNVNEFVYPGDTVTFVVTVKNSADILAKDVKIIHQLYSPDGEFIGSSLFETGDLKAGSGGKVSFGLNIPSGAAGGIYKTVSYAVAEAVNGNVITTGKSETVFKVQAGRGAGAGTEIALPAEPEGEVLGVATQAGPICTDRSQDIWIFVMLLLTSTVLLSNRLENRIDFAHAIKNRISD